MNALTMLKRDHAAVKEILEELDGTTDRGVKTRQALFSKVKRDLELQEAIEEEIFYPALKKHPKAKEIVLEASRSTRRERHRGRARGRPLRRRDVGRQAHGSEGRTHGGERVAEVWGPARRGYGACTEGRRTCLLPSVWVWSERSS